MPFIDDITCTIYVMASSVYDITFTLCVTSHNACISDIIHSMVMTYPLYIASHKVLWPHNNCVTSQPLCLSSHPLYLCHHSQWINFIKSSVCMTSQPLCVWHHMQYMGHHMHNLGCHITWCMTSGPLSLTSIPMHLCHHTNTIDDITATICMTSYPVYMWHHIRYIYDIISANYMTSQPSVLMMQHSAYAWHALHCRWQCNHSHTKLEYLWCHIYFRQENTGPVSDIAPTVSMSSHRLNWHLSNFCVTSQPISVWHHMNYI